MSLRTEQSAFLRNVVSLLEYAWSQGFEVTGGELYRTKEQQGIYLAWGRSKTLNSQHRKRLAIDLHFFKSGTMILEKSRLQDIGDWWESIDPHNRWGGNWTSFYDGGHFERTT